MRISTPAQEGQFQAAKWLKLQALVDSQELSALFDLVEPSWLLPLSGMFSMGELPVQRGDFLLEYRRWIEALQNGSIPEIKKYNALAWTKNEESFWLQEVPGNRYLVKPCEPMVHIQVHQMGYSSVDGVFRPMVLSQESIFWGLQFSFPQVIQQSKTMDLVEVEEGPNLELFQTVRKWVRERTVAIPMVVDGKRINLPMRLGKTCFSWINRHPQLVSRNFSVLELSYAG
jgi:hypothetical protein